MSNYQRVSIYGVIGRNNELGYVLHDVGFSRYTVSPIYTSFIDGMVVGIGGIMQQFACFRFVGYIWLYNIN